MGYGRALLARDVRSESEDLQKRAAKKSLWGSIGRTLGGLGAMALTGGAVNPLTLGLLTGGASFLGGAIGAKASKTGDLTKGKFFKSDREELQGELGAFGSQNIVSSLKSGITAGIGQKLKLMKSRETAAKGLDFQGSFVGRGLEKGKTSLFDAYTKKKLAADTPEAIGSGPASTFSPKTDLLSGQYDTAGKTTDWRNLDWSEKSLLWKPEEGSWLRDFYDNKY